MIRVAPMHQFYSCWLKDIFINSIPIFTTSKNKNKKYFSIFLCRLNIIWISILVTIFMSVLAKFHLFEYQVLCIGGYDGPHENFLDTCPEGQKAYITYSDMR